MISLRNVYLLAFEKTREKIKRGRDRNDSRLEEVVCKTERKKEKLERERKMEKDKEREVKRCCVPVGMKIDGVSALIYVTGVRDDVCS